MHTVRRCSPLWTKKDVHLMAEHCPVHPLKVNICMLEEWHSLGYKEENTEIFI